MAKIIESKTMNTQSRVFLGLFLTLWVKRVAPEVRSVLSQCFKNLNAQLFPAWTSALVWPVNRTKWFSIMGRRCPS